MNDKFKLALCQMEVVDNKKDNIEKAQVMIKTAANNSADIVVLPEMFNCPYENSKFREFAENVDTGETIQSISQIAKNLGIYIVAGSIPELEDDKVYNSSFIFSRQGEILGKHRKVHLFDIDVKGKITFKESDTLAAGSQITLVETEFCKIGIAICYDMRFPEVFRIMALSGAKVIIIPAAFNMVTGPAHWESLLRVRAIDNQVYVAAASPARNECSTYVAYGNSMVVEPWGKIISRTFEKEDIVYADIDISRVEEIREELPLLKHLRNDIYEIIKKEIKG